MTVSHSVQQLKTVLVLSLAFLATGCPGEVPKPGTSSPTATKPTTEPQATDDLKRIILLTNGSSPFCDACLMGLQDADRELKLKAAGLTAVMEENDGTPSGQLAKLQQYGTQSDIAAIGISVTDASNIAIAEEMKKLAEKGIKVVTIDGDCTKYRDAREVFLGTDNIVGGQELGVCAKILNPKGGGWVSFVGITCAQNAIERVSGFGTGAGKNFNKIDNMGDNFDLTKARDNVRNAIANHKGKLTTLVGIWSYNAPAIVDVVRELDCRKEYTIVTFDAEPGAIKEMQKGMIDCMVVQNPYKMGYEGVRLMRALIEDDTATMNAMYPNLGKPNGDLFDTGLKVVVPDKQSELWKQKDKFQKNTEVLTLEEFTAWLKQYGLKGS